MNPNTVNPSFNIIFYLTLLYFLVLYAALCFFAIRRFYPESGKRKLSRTENKKTAVRVKIHTFGNFDVFIDNKLAVFTKSKAKELLAYLVDRNGASVSSAEIGAVLWEDETDSFALKDRVQHVKKDLRDILAQYGVKEILISGWNSLAIDKTKVLCDYYDLLNGDTEAQKSYLGEYMTNYSWSEETAGAITSLLQKNNEN